MCGGEKKREKKKEIRMKRKKKEIKIEKLVTILSQKILNGRLLLVNIGEKK